MNVDTALWFPGFFFSLQNMFLSNVWPVENIAAGETNNLDIVIAYWSKVITRDLEVDGSQSNFYVMLNQLLFYTFYDFFYRGHEPT